MQVSRKNLDNQHRELDITVTRFQPAPINTVDITKADALFNISLGSNANTLQVMGPRYRKIYVNNAAENTLILLGSERSVSGSSLTTTRYLTSRITKTVYDTFDRNSTTTPAAARDGQIATCNDGNFPYMIYVQNGWLNYPSNNYTNG